MKIAILSSENQWFLSFAKKLMKKLKNCELFTDESQILEKNFDILFILSYHKILSKNILKNNKHNIVIHASNLPKGKGFAPFFHQILEGKNEIVFTLFEADESADNGKFYLKDKLKLTGFELYNELRKKQGNFVIKMALNFVKNHKVLKPKAQKGKESFYKRRYPKDSELNINKSIKENFNLLRICNNTDFPAFFYIKNQKYIVKIYKEKDKIFKKER